MMFAPGAAQGRSQDGLLHGRAAWRAALGRGLLMWGLASGLVWGLSACVADKPRDSKDLVTASDQTDADRRAKVRMELAEAYFGRGMNTTALDEVKQAIVAKPTSVEAYNLRGLIYASLNQPQLAEESFRHALRLAPSDLSTMHNYGWFLCQQRRFSEADAQYNTLVAQPELRDASRALLAQGVCQARDFRLADAEKTLSRAYEIDPANPATAVNLSEVLYKEGEFERARFYIRRVNSQDNLVTAQSLWLALRVENRLRQDSQVRVLGNQLRGRFPEAPETLLFEKGRFDE